MVTAVLIAGYVLVLGPLVMLGKLWRNRSWLGGFALMLGLVCAGAGWFLRGVPLVGLGHGAAALSFGVLFPLLAGRQIPVWKVVTAGLVATVVLGGLGYAVLRTQFKKTKMAKADSKKAMSDFRKRQGALKASAEGIPQAGVYTYSAFGHYTVAVSGLGTDKRVLPKTIPAILTSKGRCWTLNLRYFKQHQRTVRYCLEKDGGLRMMHLVNMNEFFGFKHYTKSRCEPDLIYSPKYKPGHVLKQVCRPFQEQKMFGKANAKATFTFIGTETLTVAGAKLRVHHLRRNLNVKSLQSADVEQHVWYHAQTGLLVRYKVNGKGWGLANFRSQFGVQLASLTPKR